MKLLQQRKLAFACARAELIKVGKNLPRLLQNLNKWEHEEEQAALQGHMDDVSSKLSLLKRPFRKVLAVDAWLAQYKHDTFRYCVFGVGRPEQFGENSVQHEPFATQSGSDVCAFLVLTAQKAHASRARLGQSRLFHYEHVLIQSVAAQSQVYCQQQHVVGRARKV